MLSWSNGPCEPVVMALKHSRSPWFSYTVLTILLLKFHLVDGALGRLCFGVVVFSVSVTGKRKTQQRLDRKKKRLLFDAGGGLLHDQIKLMCIAMHIISILKMFPHLLLQTSLLSPHHACTIVSLCKRVSFCHCCLSKSTLAIETDVESEMGINAKKTCMVVINVSKHRHQL